MILKNTITLFVFVLAVGLSRFILPKISLISFRRRLFDAVDSRKIHKDPIPRLGGVSFFPCILIAVFLGIIIANGVEGWNLLNLELTNTLLAMVCACFFLYLTGIMDDLVGVRYRGKFVVQILCSALVVSTGLYFDSFYGLFGIYELSPWFGIPFTILIMVYVMNAINLIDGIDGLASGLSGIAFIAFSAIFIYLDWWIFALLAVAALGVLIPFFYFNVFGKVERGRKIFMGDTGSLTIGLLLSIMAISLSCTNADKDAQLPGAIVIAFSFLLVPMLDVVRLVIHRTRNGKSPFMPDKNHIHHKFMAMGFTQRQAMISIVTIALLYAIFNVMLVNYWSTTLLFIVDVLVWTVGHIYITKVISDKKNSASVVKK